MGLSGLTYLAQVWVAGADGFTRTHDVLIVLAWVLNIAWMIWLAVAARRAKNLEPGMPGNEDVNRREA